METGSHEPHCAHVRHKARSEEERQTLIKRLKRAEGQIRGIQRMIENDVYCPDILTQVSAVTSALNSFSRALLISHIRTCVTDDIRRGDDEAIDEFVGILEKLMK